MNNFASIGDDSGLLKEQQGDSVLQRSLKKKRETYAQNRGVEVKKDVKDEIEDQFNEY